MNGLRFLKIGLKDKDFGEEEKKEIVEAFSDIEDVKFDIIKNNNTYKNLFDVSGFMPVITITMGFFAANIGSTMLNKFGEDLYSLAKCKIIRFKNRNSRYSIKIDIIYKDEGGQVKELNTDSAIESKEQLEDFFSKIEREFMLNNNQMQNN